MTGQELTKLWELYPEARNLYEQYNGILVEDDPAQRTHRHSGSADPKE